MAPANKFSFSVSEIDLPSEMVDKILKLLTYRDVWQAKLVCKRWKEIIDMGNLVKKAKGKTLMNLLLFSFWYIGTYVICI